MKDEDWDAPDPGHIPRHDLNRAVRRLGVAVLIQAVRYSNMSDKCYQVDAASFLNPTSESARYHLERMIELAGLSSAWFHECLARYTVHGASGAPLPGTRTCLKCKSQLPAESFVPRYEGDRARYCPRCRELTKVQPGKRRFGKRPTGLRRAPFTSSDPSKAARVPRYVEHEIHA